MGGPFFVGGWPGLMRFESNAKPKPPELRALTRLNKALGLAKGNAVVRADGGRQATVSRNIRSKGRKSCIFAGRRIERFAQKQITRSMIGGPSADNSSGAVAQLETRPLKSAHTRSLGTAAFRQRRAAPARDGAAPPPRLTRAVTIEDPAWIVLFGGNPDIARRADGPAARGSYVRPSCGLSAFSRTIRLSTCCGSWLA